jgi:hypothetical protein
LIAQFLTLVFFSRALPSYVQNAAVWRLLLRPNDFELKGGQWVHEIAPQK